MQRKIFDAQVQLIRTMINKYKISPQDTQIGVVVYGGRQVTTAIDLEQYDDKTTLLTGLDRIRNLGKPVGDTGVGFGVNEAILMFRRTKKDAFQQRLITFFDGKPKFDIGRLAMELKKDSVESIAVGVGENAGKGDIETLSPDGKGIIVNDADQLAGIAGSLEKPGQ